MGLKTHAPRLRPTAIACLISAMSCVAMLTAACTPQPAPPPVPPHAAAHANPPDWYHQQLAAARAARRAHQPASDKAGAQQAYDTVMRDACLHAAVMGPGKYTARCDAILHQAPAQTLIDPCDANADDPSVQADCSD